MAYIAELMWDEWSEDHIARHGVDPDEVEQLTANPYYVDRARNNRYRLIGQTSGGRYLTVILAHRGGGFYYVITARDATREERRLYSRQR